METIAALGIVVLGLLLVFVGVVIIMGIAIAAMFLWNIIKDFRDIR